jgi:Uma2 family endonuclease
MAQFSRRNGYFEQVHWRGKTMSEEEYHELEQLSPERKYEYINGRAYMMSGGSIAHDLIAYNTRVALNSRLCSGPCRVSGADVQVLVGKKTNGKPHFVYPDTTVSCNAADGQRDNTLVKAPRVVVEVLSPGTETRDRGIKFKGYQDCPTIQEIVLINQYSPLVEVWQRNEEYPDNPKAWHHRLYGLDETVDLLSLGIGLSMAEIYQDLNFEEDEEVEEEEEDYEE